MITNEIGYKNTLEAIRKLEEAIEQTRQKYPESKKDWVNLIIEGPLDEIEKLKAEVREYERKQLKKAS